MYVGMIEEFKKSLYQDGMPRWVNVPPPTTLTSLALFNTQGGAHGIEASPSYSR